MGARFLFRRYAKEESLAQTSDDKNSHQRESASQYAKADTKDMSYVGFTEFDL
jgi:hypothetical protein